MKTITTLLFILTTFNMNVVSETYDRINHPNFYITFDDTSNILWDEFLNLENDSLAYKYSYYLYFKKPTDILFTFRVMHDLEWITDGEEKNKIIDNSFVYYYYYKNNELNRKIVDITMGGDFSHDSVWAIEIDLNKPPCLDFITGKTYQIIFDNNDITSNNKHNSFENNITIYPNPAKDRVFIQSQKEIKYIDLFSLSGKLLQRYANTNQLILNQPQGNYILKIYTKKKHFTKKLIILK